MFTPLKETNQRLIWHLAVTGLTVGVAVTMAQASNNAQSVVQASDVVLAVEDTSGKQSLLYRPLVQYQWMSSARIGGIPEVRRVRSERVILEEETTGELHPFRWDDLRSLAPTVAPEESNRILVTLKDGQTYRCLPGYTRPGSIPDLAGAAESDAPTLVTRAIRAQRLRSGQSSGVEVPWFSLRTIEVFPLSGMSATSLKRLETLVQERERLGRRMDAVHLELIQLRDEAGGSSTTRETRP